MRSTVRCESCGAMSDVSYRCTHCGHDLAGEHETHGRQAR